MRILDGKRQRTMTGDEFANLIANYDAIDLDVGTGDGRFVIDRATRHPERLVIGLDPVAEAMERAANRASRPRTRVENVLFVVASIEQLPDQLADRCARVFVLFPWGSLMSGLILGETATLESLSRLGRPGATYRILLNRRIFSDPVPIQAQDLPEPTVSYARRVLLPRFERAGLTVDEILNADADTVANLPTTWSRRLSHRNPPPTLEIKAHRDAPSRVNVKYRRDE